MLPGRLPPPSPPHPSSPDEPSVPQKTASYKSCAPPRSEPADQRAAAAVHSGNQSATADQTWRIASPKLSAQAPGCAAFPVRVRPRHPAVPELPPRQIPFGSQHQVYSDRLLSPP